MRNYYQFFSLLVFFFSLLPLQAQEGDPRIAATKTPLSEVDLLLMPPVDNAALRQAEMERRAPGLAPRFAEAFPVRVTPAGHGHWEEVSGREAVWRLRILSKGAYSLNLGFTRFRLPRGASLILYSFDRRRVMGPFTPADNEEHAQLWTPVFAGDALVIELRLPADKRADLDLELGYVNHDFLNFAELLSGGCNLDVACGRKDGWGILDQYRDIIQSAGIYGFSGDSFCSGFLVNNAGNNCTPYFMTANHCGVNTGNASSVVVYWNFQNSYCRQPGSPANNGRGDGRLTIFNSGAVFRAGFATSDFTLLELDDPIPLAANAFFAGWSADREPPSDTTICIHHPNSNEKRISFNFDAVKIGVWGSGDQAIADGNHLIVNNWEIGTTEIGSSGGPLFNRKKQVIGQLHGGLASCNNRLYDQFGWFHSSWEGGGTKATSLRPWLDPNNLGITSLDGRWQNECGGALEVVKARQAVCAPAPVRYQLKVSTQFTGAVTLSVEGLPAGAGGSFSRNPVLPGESTTLAISNTGGVLPGEYELSVKASDGSAVFISLLALTVSRERPAPVTTVSPAGEATDVNPTVDFSWEPQSPGTLYELSIAADPAFAVPVTTIDNLTTAAYRGLPLDRKTTYYWRVRGHNACGPGDWSTGQMFTTADVQCRTFNATDLPQEIPRLGTHTLMSAINADVEGSVIGVEIGNLDIIHSFVGDLRVRLTSPAGTSITLFDRIGWPGSFNGCEGDNLILAFSDTAALTPQQLENTCDLRPAAIGFFRPLQAFSAFAGEPALGPWTLIVEDVSYDDGGKFNDWTLDLCVARSRDFSLKSAATSYQACLDHPFRFDITVGQDFRKSGVTLSAAGLPPGAVLHFSQNPAPPGATITGTVEGLTDRNTFQLTVFGTDSIMNTSTAIEVQVVGEPALVSLLAPANKEVLGSPLPTLTWGAGPEAAGYRLEVADDDHFQQLLLEEWLSDTLFTLVEPLAPGPYYWRVTANNKCGGSTSAAQSFTVQTTSSGQAAAERVMLYPNPVHDLLFLQFTTAPPADLSLELFDSKGRRLRLLPVAAGAATLQTDLSIYPSGVYLLRFRSREGIFIHRIVLQR